MIYQNNFVLLQPIMKIPAKISEAARELIAMFGEKLAYIGEHEGSAVYQFKFPDNQEVGFPVLYLLKDDKVTEINGPETFKILDLLIKD